jgi:hypothetical protein
LLKLNTLLIIIVSGAAVACGSTRGDDSKQLRELQATVAALQHSLAQATASPSATSSTAATATGTAIAIVLPTLTPIPAESVAVVTSTPPPQPTLEAVPDSPIVAQAKQWLRPFQSLLGQAFPAMSQ